MKIEETYETAVVVEAKAEWEAEEKVRDMIRNHEIVLTEADYKSNYLDAREVVRARID